MGEAENAYGRLKALRANTPEHEVPSDMVEEYHNILDQLQKTTGQDHGIHRIPPNKVKPVVTGGNYETGEVRYSDDSYCDRDYFMMKLMGVPAPDPEVEAVSPAGALDTVEMICKRFSDVLHEIKERPRGREPLLMADEYDVQYLMGGLLRLHFDDIRREEWTPSYAGGAAKMDFLLKAEGIVIETKMTREKLDANELGKQLLVDIAKYEEHPDCKMLVCFVYDPTGRIKNAPGVIVDLEKKSGKIRIKVFIER